jgi:CheY-like chemotaxis protein
MLNKILCVDDDPITLMLCKKVILKSEFSNQIEIAKNGKEALNYFDSLINEKVEKNAFPELIFLDLNMPVMDGWEFLEEFNKNKYKNLFNKTKIIILSSTVDPKDINKSKNYSIVINFIAKPITKEILQNINL